MLTIPPRIYERVMLQTVQWENCLVSTYSLGSHGYAQVGWTEAGERHMVLCHRVVWEHHNGPVPAGYVIDHTCHVRPCITLSHLRLLTNYENARRTDGRDWPLGQCANGHSNEYLVVSDGGRRIRCRLCRNATQQRYRAKRKQLT
jgi:hypothetical protein